LREEESFETKEPKDNGQGLTGGEKPPGKDVAGKSFKLWWEWEIRKARPGSADSNFH